MPEVSPYEDPAVPEPTETGFPYPTPVPASYASRTPRAGSSPFGAHAAVYIAAGATLLPFLQALAGAVGTRVGERLDDAARGALRRLLRRELEEGAPGESGPAPRFLTTQGGTRIRLDADLPEEALPQLLTMAFGPLEEGDPDAPALVRWTSAGWLATVADSGQLHDLNWDFGRSEWVGSTASPASQ
ncbi:hypothetical protein [Streptomyces sp. SID13726]|uniref:hypothetical protein n=1 Tax=Streptomyces sp. SID13726 TaxID=2706058 RepID=UPI0013B9B1DC|nr:hypothetical protein [Streptomyces sp. SID13726]NEB04324.1 hypothetical protein [Streptomyces sp. SID13726]